jgi:DNA-binding SARP family transcriptional activator
VDVDVSGGAGTDAGSGAETGSALPAPRGRPAGRDVEAAVRVRLLGRFDVAVGGVPVDLAKARPRVRATLQMLALHAGTFVHREVLAETLWPDADPEAGQRGLQVAISALRGLLEPDGAPRHSERLPRRGDAYALVLPAGCSTDVQDLDSALARARDARRSGDLEAAVRSWREAVDLYRGPLLPEQGSAEWVLPERDRLRQATADAAESLGRALSGSGDDRAALDALRRALDLDPFRDGAWRALVQLHEAQGDRSAAQAARLRHRRVLAELGVSAEDI